MIRAEPQAQLSAFAAPGSYAEELTAGLRKAERGWLQRRADELSQSGRIPNQAGDRRNGPLHESAVLRDCELPPCRLAGPPRYRRAWARNRRVSVHNTRLAGAPNSSGWL